MRHIALLLAGGKGSRMNAPLPKQYIEVDGESVILHTMRAFQQHPLITDIYVVCAREWEVEVQQQAQRGGVDKFRGTIAGGATGFESIRNGIEGLAPTLSPAGRGAEDSTPAANHSPYRKEVDGAEALVLVHDAVRPLVTQDIISRNIAVCLTHGNAITALPSHEAFMRTADGQSSGAYIPRDQLMRAQTPHTFPLSQLRQMLREANEQGIRQSQSLYTLANELGHTPLYIALGDALNFKLTIPSDILIYQALKDIV